MAKAPIRGLFVILIGASCLYLGDTVALHFRKDVTSSVRVRSYYAVPRKDKREEFMFDDARDETCVNAIFPHQQMSPCWFLRRHPEKRISL